jgi:hypothetical protein
MPECSNCASEQAMLYECPCVDVPCPRERVCKACRSGIVREVVRESEAWLAQRLREWDEAVADGTIDERARVWAEETPSVEEQVKRRQAFRRAVRDGA